MIYTSYFANIRNLPEHIVPISISGKAPDGYKGLQYKKLAPKYDFFMEWKQTHDNNMYIRCFKEQVLSKLNLMQVLSELDRLSQGKAICLVCYEKPSDFCHRHIVAEWFNSQGVPCKEFEKGDS